MDLSALQAAAKALERSLDSLGFWLFVFTALVVVGLIAEYRHEVVDFWEEVKRPAAMFPWPKFWAIAGGVLVTVGVAGELIVGIKASRKEGTLRIIHHQIETLLTEKASENEREAKRLELTRVTIEAKVAWRRLSKGQQSVIADHLKNFTEVRIGVSYLGGMPESSEFANDIEAALRAAKLKLLPREPFSLFGGYGGGVYPLHPLTGVNISGVGNRGREAAAAIQRELCAAGFDTTITDKPDAGIFEPHPEIDVAVLAVGRPITKQGATQLQINTKTRDCTGSH